VIHSRSIARGATALGHRSPLDAVRFVGVLAVVSVGSLVFVSSFTIAVPGSNLWPVASTALAAFGLVSLAAIVREGSADAGVVGAREVFAAVYCVNGSIVPLLATANPARLLGDTSSPDGSLGAVLGMAAFAYIALSLTCFPVRVRMPKTARVLRVQHIAWAMVLLGLIGLYIRFPSVASILGYFSGSYDEVSQRAEGMVGFAGSILRPMLPAGLMLMWFAKPGLVRTSALVLGSVLAFGSFALNRASLFVPFAAFVIGFHRHRKRLSSALLVGVFIVALVAFLQIGAFRTVTLNSQGGKYDVDNPLSDGLVSEAAHSVQVYGQTPVRTGVVMDTTGWADLRPSNFVSSVTSPVPGTSEAMRDGSVTIAYNRLIYGSSDVTDQIVPLPLEAYWTMGAAGLVMAALAVGLVLRRLDAQLKVSSTLPETVGLMIAACWWGQSLIISSTVLVQATIYWGPAAIAMVYLSRRAN
jgi:hypothetical protein